MTFHRSLGSQLNAPTNFDYEAGLNTSFKMSICKGVDKSDYKDYGMVKFYDIPFLIYFKKMYGKSNKFTDYLIEKHKGAMKC